MDLAQRRRMASELKRAIPRQAQGGFSLIELIVVFAIIFIAASTAIPAIADYIKNYRIKGATESLATEIQAARAQAIKRNVNHGVVFAIVSATEYQYFIEDNPGHGLDSVNQPWFVPVNDAGRAPGAAFESLNGPRRNLPLGVQFRAAGGGDCALRFDRMGTMCQPGDTTKQCDDIAVGTNCPATTYISFATGTATVTLDSPRTGLSRTVSVAPGGRVFPQQ
jgi:type II secretory pathway pseudopilin PulG